MVRLSLHELRPTSSVMVEREDGAMVCAHVFSPEGVVERPGRPFGVDLSRPPLVLLHGNGEDSCTLAPLIQAFREERTVVAVDSRGQGFSSRGTRPLTYETMAEDVLEVMSRLSITRAHVAGYSDGGIIGLLMASTARHRVLTLTTMGANLTPAGLTDECRAEIRAAVHEYDLDRAPRIGDPVWHASVRELLMLMLTEPHILGATLKRVACPVLVVAGEHDVVKREETRSIAQAIEHARLLIVPDAGHDLVNEEPQLMADLIGHQMELCDPVVTPRAPRPASDLVVLPVGIDRWGTVEEVFERVLDTCEGPDADTSGWKRGFWPDYDNVRAHVARGTMRACYRREDVEEAGGRLVAKPGAPALGVMSVDHDIDVDESVLNWLIRPEREVFCLHLFATNPCFRGRGAADTLLAAFIDEGLDAGVEVFRLNTSPENVSSNGLYQARGFKLYRAAYFPYRGLALTPWSNCYELSAEDARALKAAL